MRILKPLIRMAVLAVFVLSIGVLFIAAQDHAMNTKEHQLTHRDVKALIVSAKTPEDHLKLASYFKVEAQRQDDSAKYHDEMSELYKSNQPAHIDMAKHCKFFADAARQASEAANSMAEDHAKMATQLREGK